MLKKFVFSTVGLLIVFLIACSGEKLSGGTIDPNSNPLANTFSSSDMEEGTLLSSSMMASDVQEESSESKDAEVLLSSTERTETSSSSQGGDKNGFDRNPQSSAAASNRGNRTVTPKNYSLECLMDLADVVEGDSGAVDTPSTPKDMLITYASISVAADSVNIFVSDFLGIPCDEGEAEAFVEELKAQEKVSFNLAGDTLHIDVARNKAMTYDCMCVATVKITLDASYSGLKYTVLEQRDAILIEELE